MAAELGPEFTLKERCALLLLRSRYEEIRRVSQNPPLPNRATPRAPVDSRPSDPDDVTR